MELKEQTSIKKKKGGCLVLIDSSGAFRWKCSWFSFLLFAQWESPCLIPPAEMRDFRRLLCTSGEKWMPL